MAVATTLGFNILVIEIRRYPTGGTVTVVTLCCSGQVIKILTHGSDAIVATAAATQYLEVIDRDGRIPQVGAVAVFADVSSCDMVKSLTGRGHAIVAVTTALSSNILVIEVGR